MTTNRVPRPTEAAAIALSVLAASLLTACGTPAPTPGAGAYNSGTTTTSPSKSAAEPVPTQLKSYDPNNPIDVPTDIPQPIPVPEPPANPKELSVKAVADTVNSTAINALVANAPSVVSVSVTLRWSKAENAASYRVSRNDGDGTANYTIRANVPATFSGFLDGGASLLALKVDQDYSYLVEALDSSGKVLAKGMDKTKALYPLPVPAPISPENNRENATIQPEFNWNSINGAQGYFLEVFSGVYYVPMWRGYRSSQLGTTIKYGENVDMMPGTQPAIFCTFLNPTGVYTWSVTAVKTDTGNAATAKAWAKSNSNAWRFYCGAKPTTTTTGGN